MSVEFEPVNLGQRRRRLDPVSIGAFAVAVALTAAILKPWDGAASAGSAAEAIPVLAPSMNLTGPHATASLARPRAGTAGSGLSPSWAELEPVVQRHELWGIRAIVINNAADAAVANERRYAERWFPLPNHGERTPTAQVDPGDRSIVALGITFPPTHAPLDARIWRVASDGLEWIDTRAIDTVPSGGAFLYLMGGDPAGPWASGTYRVDVLVDGSVRRFGVTIPDRFSNVPGVTRRPALRAAGPLADPADAPLTNLAIGLFATVDGAAVSIPADEGPALAEAAAWLDVDPGTRRAPRTFVAAEHLPRATGLGVILPPRSIVMEATLARLAPEPLPIVPARVDEGARDGAPTSHVLFRAPDGGTWAPGIYRLSLVWADFDGLHEGSWHVELRPGPVRELPRLLAAARAWARYAGATGVILGTTEPLEGGPRSAAIRLLRIKPELDASYPAATGVGCGGTVVEGRPGILGFAYPADHYAATATARILLPFPRRQDQVVMTAAFGVRGLILVAPARRPTLPGASYVFSVGTGNDAQDYALCLGMAAFDD